jgi:hypothetical protein
MGLGCILSYPNGVIIGGKDSILKVFNTEYEFVNEAQLDSAVTAMSLSPDRLEVCSSSILS